MRTLKTFVLAAVAMALVASPAWAQVNLNDATRKARGDYGQRAAVARSFRVERMAPAPAAERVFSFEPAPAAKGCPAPAVEKAAPQKAPEKAAAVAPAPKRVFSYEPAQRNVRTFRAPRKDAPTYMLPKGDSHRTDGTIRW